MVFRCMLDLLFMEVRSKFIREFFNLGDGLSHAIVVIPPLSSVMIPATVDDVFFVSLVP